MGGKKMTGFCTAARFRTVTTTERIDHEPTAQRRATIVGIRYFLPIVMCLVFASRPAQASDWVVENLGLGETVGYSLDIECQDPNDVNLLYDVPSAPYDYHAIRDASGWLYYYSYDNYTKFDLALDSRNLPRILSTIYNGSTSTHELTYWQQTPSGHWYYPVASNVNGGNAKLGIDQQDNAYLAFIESSTLKCAKIEGDLGGTCNVDIDPVVTDPLFSSSNERIKLAMDSAGNPNILWYDYGASELKRAFQQISGGAWQVDTIYTGNISHGFAAAFDSSNNLHVAYGDGIPGTWYNQIRHAVYDGTQWNDEQASAAGDQVGALVIDSYDQVHIGYVDFDTDADKDVVRYATNLGTSWHDEAVYEMPSSSQGLEELDMVMDSQGHLHMAFRGDAHELRYARLDEPPRPQLTEERSTTVSLDAQAEYTSGVGFVINDGEYGINVFKYSDIDRRGILEFFIDALAINEELVSARLELEICSMTCSETSWPTPQVYAYEGDGNIDPSDAEKTTNLAGTSEEIQELGMHSIDLDPEILAAQLEGNNWLGLLLMSFEEQTGFWSLESSGFSTPATLVLEIASHLFGDASRDGKVDADDALILSSHWLMQSGAHWTDGDFNGDHKVDAEDAVLLAINWNKSKYTGYTAVPEPGSLWLLLAGAVILLSGKLATSNRRRFH